MSTDHMLNIEEIWEIRIERQQLEINFVREQLLLMKRERMALEADARLTEDLSCQQPQPQPGKDTKTSSSEYRVRGMPEGLAFDDLNDFNSIPRREKSAIQSTQENILLTPTLATFGTKSNEVKYEGQKQVIDTTNEPPPPPPPPPRSLRVKLKLPTGSRQPKIVHKPTQRRSKNYMQKPNQTTIKPKRRTALVIAQELQLELSELDSENIERPTKRQRPYAGAYELPDQPDDLERRELLTRLCKPIIQLFRTALKRVIRGTSGVSLAFRALEAELDEGSLTTVDEFLSRLTGLKEILATTTFHCGTDSTILISRLDRWAEECAECMDHCSIGDYAYERLRTVDRFVDSLEREFASLSEDLIPIVKSDVLQ